MNTIDTKTSLTTITLEVTDPAAAREFYTAAFGPDLPIGLRASAAPTSGFRGCTLSLTVSQPGNVDLLVDAALAAGATTLKPVTKSFWGYGGSFRAPDGTIWKVATSAKKDAAPPSRAYDDVVLLLGATDVAATKRFYLEQGLTVARSFGKKYVEFDSGPSSLKLALYGRRALAKDAGVPVDGSGSHRIVLGGGPASFTDPDGFRWEADAT